MAAASRGRSWLVVLSYLCIIMRSTDAQKSLYQVKGEDYMLGDAGPAGRQSTNDKLLNTVTSTISPEDCETKYDKMKTAFKFYRGTAQFYYRDMSDQNVVGRSAFFDAGATPWVQGDMHVMNMGVFDLADGTVVYDINDFDEGVVANYLYDVYRLAASVVVAAQFHGVSETAPLVKSLATSYVGQMGRLARGEARADAFLTADTAKGLIKELLEQHPKDQFDGKKRYKSKYVDYKHEKLATEKNPTDLAALSKKERGRVEDGWKDYYKGTALYGRLGKGDGKSYFELLDVARRLEAGTGSLGTSRYYALVAGPSSKHPEDDRILDLKFQGVGSLQTYSAPDRTYASFVGYDTEAQRTVLAAQALIGSSYADQHLGTIALKAGAYSVRERSAFKDTLRALDPDPTKPEEAVPLGAAEFGVLSEQWGQLLANAHARSSKGNEKYGVPADFVQRVYDKTRGREDEFADEVYGVAAGYGKQVSVDHRLFLRSLQGDKLCVGAGEGPVKATGKDEL